MSRNKKYNKEIIKETIQEEKEVCDTEHQEIVIYRVRKDWNDQSSQIFANTDLDICIDFVNSRPGYKVFVGDDGEIVYDPNDYIIPKKEKVKNSPMYNSIYKGSRLRLNNTPVYKSVTDNVPYLYVSGDNFFYYSSDIVHGKVMITKSTDMSKYGKDGSIVLGWIKLREE